MAGPIVLEVLPTTSVDAGDPERQVELCMAAFQTAPVNLLTFRFPNTGTITDDLVRELFDLVGASLDASSRILIDACFDSSIFRAQVTVDILLSDALRQNQEKLKSDAEVVIFLESLPVVGDQLQAIAEDPTFADRIVFVGQQRPEPDGTTHNDESAFQSAPSANVNALSRNTLRQRGVFAARRRSTPSRYYGYRYSLLQPGFEALIDLLVTYFSTQDVQFAIYDKGSAGDWFASCVTAAAGMSGVGVVDLELALDRSEPSSAGTRSSVENAIAAIRSGDRVILMVPALKSGVAIFEKYQMLVGDDHPATRLLAVYLDDANCPHEGPNEEMGTRTLVRPDVTPIDYFVSAPLSFIDELDWNYRVAATLNEIWHPSAREAPLHTVAGMIAMYNEYGAAAERLPTPPRNPISFFPNLHKLDEWDAHWLTEALLHKVEDSLGALHRARLLVVVPDEDTGARPIFRALRERMGVTCVSVPKQSVLQGQLAADDIRDLQIFSVGSRIVVLDESTVSHATLVRLGVLVQEATGRTPDAYASLIDLSDERWTLAAPIICLDSWHPLRKVHVDAARSAGA